MFKDNENPSQDNGQESNIINIDSKFIFNNQFIDSNGRVLSMMQSFKGIKPVFMKDKEPESKYYLYINTRKIFI